MNEQNPGKPTDPEGGGASRWARDYVFLDFWELWAINVLKLLAGLLYLGGIISWCSNAGPSKQELLLRSNDVAGSSVVERIELDAERWVSSIESVVVILIGAVFQFMAHVVQLRGTIRAAGQSRGA